MVDNPSGTLDIEAAAALEKKYDSSLVTRSNGAVVGPFLYTSPSPLPSIISGPQVSARRWTTSTWGYTSPVFLS